MQIVLKISLTKAFLVIRWKHIFSFTVSRGRQNNVFNKKLVREALVFSRHDLELFKSNWPLYLTIHRISENKCMWYNGILPPCGFVLPIVIISLVYLKMQRAPFRRRCSLDIKVWVSGVELSDCDLCSCISCQFLFLLNSKWQAWGHMWFLW